MGALGPLLTIARKDFLLELRNRDILVSLVVFAMLVLIIFNFAIELTAVNLDALGPGILWVAIAFAGVIGLNRTFVLEKDHDALDGLMLAPVSRDTIFLGKALGSMGFILLSELVIFPVFAALFGVDILRLETLAVALLASLGLAAAGTVFGAMAVSTRSREIMLPVLFLPVISPVLIGAVEATARVASGASWSAVSQWLQIIAVFDLVFVVAGVLLFQYVLED
ncbi:MAG: heme ABC transporter permease CcmB [SAR202 cluster bacterium]|nr:heme ABC transporter permease CcmB [SAR202 cluster bacterium]